MLCKVQWQGWLEDLLCYIQSAALYPSNSTRDVKPWAVQCVFSCKWLPYADVYHGYNGIYNTGTWISRALRARLCAFGGAMMSGNVCNHAMWAHFPIQHAFTSVLLMSFDALGEYNDLLGYPEWWKLCSRCCSGPSCGYPGSTCSRQAW